MIRRLLAVAIAVAVAATAITPVNAADPVPPSATAPVFTLTDSAGAQVALSSFAGKVVVLEWVNYDCPFVKKHYASGNIPAMQTAWTAKGVVWLSICSSAVGKQGHFDGAALTTRIAAEKAAPSHYLIDADGAVGRAYGAQTTPQIVVIDGGGVVRYHGAIDSIRSTDAADVPKATNYAHAALTAVLAGTPVAEAQTKSYGCSVKYGM